jgi:hypothetical protein
MVSSTDWHANDLTSQIGYGYLVCLIRFESRTSSSTDNGWLAQPQPRSDFRSATCQGRGPFAAAMLEAEAVAVHLQDVDMMGEPVQQCAGETFGAEDLGPLLEGQIAGYQGGSAFGSWSSRPWNSGKSKGPDRLRNPGLCRSESRCLLHRQRNLIGLLRAGPLRRTIHRRG